MSESKNIDNDDLDLSDELKPDMPKQIIRMQKPIEQMQKDMPAMQKRIW